MNISYYIISSRCKSIFVLLLIIVNSSSALNSIRTKASTSSLCRSKNNTSLYCSSPPSTPSSFSSTPSSSSTSISADANSNVIINKKLQQKLYIISASNCISYLSIIAAAMTLPSSLFAISSDALLLATSGKESLNGMVAIATLLTCLGKFLLAPPTDHFGGVLSLKFTMAMMTLLLLVCSFAKSLPVFNISWAVLSFIYATGWGAVLKVIRDSFPESMWSSQISLIAASSRFSSMAAAFAYGSILGRSNGNWRKVFQVGATVQFLSLIAMNFALNKVDFDEKISTSPSSLPSASSSSQTSPLLSEKESVKEVLTRVSKVPTFWLMLLTKTCLMTVGQFISFIPLFLATGVNLKMPQSSAAQSSAVFALGSFLSTIVGARYYSQLSENQKRVSVAIFNASGFIISIILTLQQASVISISVPFVLALLTLWGVAWALPFYTPPGVEALRLGGKEHSALLTNVYDAVGFFGAAVFSWIAMKQGRAGKWVGVLTILSVCEGLALVFEYFGMSKSINKMKNK